MSGWPERCTWVEYSGPEVPLADIPRPSGSVGDLQAELTALGLATTGSKRELQDRLQRANQATTRMTPLRVFLPVCYGGPDHCYCSTFEGPVATTIGQLRAEVAELNERLAERNRWWAALSRADRTQAQLAVDLKAARAAATRWSRRYCRDIEAPRLIDCPDCGESAHGPTKQQLRDRIRELEMRLARLARDEG